MSREAESRFAGTARLGLAYQASGTGEAFVLLHGFTGAKSDFRDHLHAFDDLRRTVVYDQRGHGGSDRGGPYDFATLVDDLIALLDALQIERCDLLGHSLGGMVAMRAVLRRPERFRSLVLMDTAPAPLPLWSWRARWQLRRLVRRHGCEALLEGARRAPQSEPVRRGIEFVGEAAYWQRRRDALRSLDPDAYCGLMDTLRRHEPVASRLAGISCPTTVLVGEFDTPFLAPARLMADTIPGVRLVTIAGAEHSPQLENADAWRGAARDHLLQWKSP